MQSPGFIAIFHAVWKNTLFLHSHVLVPPTFPFKDELSDSTQPHRLNAALLVIPQDPVDLANRVFVSPITVVICASGPQTCGPKSYSFCLSRTISHYKWDDHIIYHQTQSDAYICELIKSCTPPKLTMLQAYWPSFYSSNIPASFQPQRLCTSCPLCLECFSSELHYRCQLFKPQLSHYLSWASLSGPLCPLSFTLSYIVFTVFIAIGSDLSVISMSPFQCSPQGLIYVVKIHRERSESKVLKPEHLRLNPGSITS